MRLAADLRETELRRRQKVTTTTTCRCHDIVLFLDLEGDGKP